MIWSRERVIQGTRKAAYALAATTVCFVALSQPALATQVQASMLFDVAASSDASAVAEKCGTSLGNCLQLIVGSHARVLARVLAIVHLACDEDDRTDTRVLSQAVCRVSIRPNGEMRAWTHPDFLRSAPNGGPQRGPGGPCTLQRSLSPPRQPGEQSIEAHAKANELHRQKHAQQRAQ